MADLIPCPSCKKKISAEAQACPKCGQPITDGARAAGRKKMAEEKRAGRVGCLIFIGLVLALAWWMNGSTSFDQQAQKAITPTLKKGEHISDLAVAPLCGGKAARMNSHADYWVKDGKAYTANGIASGYSPKAPLAPPSISHNEVEQALAGKQIALPTTHLNVMWSLFLDRLDDAAKAQGLPPLQQEGHYGRKLVCKSGQKAMVEMREVCGAVVEVQAIADCVKGNKDNDLTTALALRVVTAVLSPDVTAEDRTKALALAIEKAGKNPGEYVDFTLGKVAYKLIALKGDKKGEFRIGLEATARQPANS